MANITPGPSLQINRTWQCGLAAFSLSIVAVFGYLMFRNGQSITGPFIFGDELEYFSYGRNLWLGADISKHTQYGLLYPAIISLFLRLGDFESVYWLLRIFNITVFASSVVPAFLLARLICPHHRWIWVWFGVLAATAPFGGLVYVIWADPLYYTLFLWTVFLLVSFYRRPTISLGAIVGVLLALMFHTKPAAGVIAQFAAFISLIAFIFLTHRGDRRHLIAPIGALLLFCFLLTAPWIVRNLSLGVGPIGYRTMSGYLAGRVAEHGSLHIIIEMFLSLFYQASYLFVGMWGVLGILLVLSISRWRRLSTAMRASVIFIAACTAGLVVVVAITNTAIEVEGNRYWMSIGRYEEIVFPAAMLFGVYLLTLDPPSGRFERSVMICLTFALAAVAVCATPLYGMRTKGFIDNPGFALANAVIDQGQFVWRSEYDPSIIQRVGLVVPFIFLGITWIFAARWRSVIVVPVCLALSGSLLASVAELHYVKMMGSTQAGFNDTIRFVSLQSPDARNTVALDRKLESPDNRFWVGFIAGFWGGSAAKIQYLDLRASDGVEHVHDLPVPKYVISREFFDLPVAFSSQGLFVYDFSGDKRRPIPEYRSGEILSFSAGSNGAKFLRNGWSAQEKWGTWSIGEQSDIALRLTPPATGHIRLSVRGIAFVHSGRMDQHIAVFANGKQIDNWSYRSGEELKKFSVDIPQEMLEDSSILSLKFVPQTVDSPQQAGVSADPRRLAFGLVEMTVSPAPEIKK